MHDSAVLRPEDSIHYTCRHIEVSSNWGNPSKSSTLMRFSIVNQPAMYPYVSQLKHHETSISIVVSQTGAQWREALAMLRSFESWQAGILGWLNSGNLSRAHGSSWACYPVIRKGLRSELGVFILTIYSQPSNSTFSRDIGKQKKGDCDLVWFHWHPRRSSLATTIDKTEKICLGSRVV